MFDRGDMVVGGLSPAVSERDQAARDLHTAAAPARRAHHLRLPLTIAALTLLLTLIPGRAKIPPLVQSDYAYMLIAANRMHDGLGYSSLQPNAPNQPWSWRADFDWLSQWPPAYPWTIVATRKVTGWSTIQACRHLSTIFTAIALVGWFALVKSSVPSGVTGTVLAAVASGQAVSAAMLIDPSTDLMLCAAIPYVLMLAGRALQRARATDFQPVEDTGCQPVPHRWMGANALVLGRHRIDGFCRLAGRALGLRCGRHGQAELVRGTQSVFPSTHQITSDAAPVAWALAGLAAGVLFWIRYAGLFVPIGIGGVLAVSLWRRNVRPTHVAAFAISAAVPIVGLVLLHRAMSSGGSVQETLNLGTRVGFDFSLATVAEAWQRMTDLGFYDHLWYSRWVISLWPLAGAALLIVPAVRRAGRRYLSIPTVGLGLALAITLPMMLVLATILFKGKFDYVGLDRYYIPLRPLYFLLFVGPLLLVPQKWTRAVLMVGLCIAGSWTVQQSWARAYQRRSTADRPVTAYGERSVCFNPDAVELYDWLRQQADPSLIVISNFHDYITLETGIPALPPPSDESALHDWIGRIIEARRISQARVLFVLDPDNGYRQYYLPDPAKLIERFALTPVEDAPPSISKWVHEYRPAGASASLTASTSAG